MRKSLKQSAITTSKCHEILVGRAPNAILVWSSRDGVVDPELFQQVVKSAVKGGLVKAVPVIAPAAAQKAA